MEIYSDPSGVCDHRDTEPGRALSIVSVSPNPIGSSTQISFESASAGWALLKVYDVSGKLVSTRSLGSPGPGTHSVRWDGRDDPRRRVGSGIYYLRISSQGLDSDPVKVVLIR
jgi:flagellar hook assembly protein FlgD